MQNCWPAALQTQPLELPMAHIYHHITTSLECKSHNNMPLGGGGIGMRLRIMLHSPICLPSSIACCCVKQKPTKFVVVLHVSQVLCPLASCESRVSQVECNDCNTKNGNQHPNIETLTLHHCQSLKLTTHRTVDNGHHHNHMEAGPTTTAVNGMELVCITLKCCAAFNASAPEGKSKAQPGHFGVNTRVAESNEGQHKVQSDRGMNRLGYKSWGR